MGHISNPIALRLNNSRLWSVKGGSLKYNYQEAFFKQFIILTKTYFCCKRFQRLGLLYSHSIFSVNSSKFSKIKIFLYDARFELLKANLLFRINRRKKKQRVYILRLFRRKPISLRISRKLFINKYFKKSIKRFVQVFLFKNFRRYWWKSIFLKSTKLFSHYNKFKTSLKFEIEPISNSIVTAKALGIYAVRKLKANFSLQQI